MPLPLALLLIALTVPACREKPTTTNPAAMRPLGPPALVLEHRFVDLGRLTPHSSREVQVALRNDGAGELVISRIETGCECIRASMERQRIGPGRSEALLLEVRTLARRGPYRGEIAIASNEPGGVAVLTVLFEVPEAVSTDPPTLYLGVLTPGAEIVKPVKLAAGPGVATEILRAASGDPSVAGRIVTPAVAAGEDGVVEVTIRAPVEPGLYRHNLSITTALPDRPTVNLPVVFAVSAAADVAPDRIDFGRFPRGQRPRRSLRVTAGPGTSVQAAVPHPIVLDVTIAPPEEAGGVTVTVSPKPEAPYGPLDGELRIHLDGAEPNTLVVPFTGYVAEAAP